MGFTTKIDWSMANLLLEASILAYAAFDGTATCQPVCLDGYDFIECWTGVDEVFVPGLTTVEVFGVVFRSPPPGPYTYIFAFRGTDSLLDIIEDLSFYQYKETFVPFGAQSPPDSEAGVASGFWSVYTASTGTTSSMQSQLFRLLDKYQQSAFPISRLLVTGHSLGASLSQLFTLDLAYSTHSSIPAVNYNYACPKTGNAHFADLFDAQPLQHDPATRALRIQNTYDIVPCNPPTLWYGYEQAGDAFLVAFYGKDVEWWDPYAKYYDHQAFNYQAVLNCASRSANGVCISHDLPVTTDGEHLVSKEPDASTVCSIWPAAMPAQGTPRGRPRNP